MTRKDCQKESDSPPPFPSPLINPSSPLLKNLEQTKEGRTWAGVFESKVLIIETLAIDGDTTATIAVGEVAALTHKIRDDPVERGALVTDALLAGAQGAEVFRRLGHHIGPQFHDNAADRLIADGDIEKHLRVRRIAHGCLPFGRLRVVRFCDCRRRVRVFRPLCSFFFLEEPAGETASERSGHGCFSCFSAW